MLLRSALVATALTVLSSFALAQQSTVKQSGRYVAMTPPPAGENSYPNFLWVIDTQTGQVTAYRIASAKNSDGKGSTWVTEKIFSEAEYFNILENQKNQPASK